MKKIYNGMLSGGAPKNPEYYRMTSRGIVENIHPVTQIVSSIKQQILSTI
jgi:hypothetical protein